MATRFYLPGNAVTGTAPVAVTPSTVWDVTTTFEARPTDTTRANTAFSTQARAKGSTTAWHDRLDVQFVSGRRLAAQTIAAGSISAVLRTLESVTTADFTLQIVARVFSGDGGTERGVIYAGDALTAAVATVGAQNEEFPTTSATRIWNAISTSAVTAQAGDRIVIEVGARGGGVTSTDTFNLRFGDLDDARGDFALTSGLTTELCPWVELSANLAWQAIPNRSSSTARFRATTR